MKKIRTFSDFVVVTLGLLLIAVGCVTGCAALGSITPAGRQVAYQKEAQTVEVLCKAYRFDRATGLTLEAPAMTRLCAGLE